MEPKKNPKYDVNRYRTSLFSIGLICSVAIVIMAFHWKVELIKKTTPKLQPPDDMITYVVPATSFEQPKALEKIVHVKFATSFTESKVDDIIEANEPDLIIDPSLIETTASRVEVAVELPSGDEPLIKSEVAPEPVGGYENFYKILQNNMRYPRPAQQKNISGKVFVQFVVGRNGEISDMHVIKGIGGGCDEEAMRVIKLAQWKPGKQRGVAVRVRMTQPIIFQLN